MDADESRLVARCRAGESSAWDELFDRHYEPASHFVWQLHGAFTPEDVEEICQDAFLTVIRSLNTFHGHSRLQTWIFSSQTQLPSGAAGASRRGFQSSPPTLPPSWELRSTVNLGGRSQQINAIEIPTNAPTFKQDQSPR